MKKSWRFSLQWVQWVRKRGNKPKRNGCQPIDRHYYRDTPTREEQSEAKKRIHQCVDGFLASEIPEFIARFPVETWRGLRLRTQDYLPSFGCGRSLWSSYDFAIQTPKVTYIIDWKTGRETETSFRRAAEQLRWYALYATTEWHVPVEQIRLMPVWLGADVTWRVLVIEQADLDGLQHRIEERYAHLSERLSPLEGPIIPLADWPMTDNQKECRTCPFHRHVSGIEAHSRRRTIRHGC